MDTLDMIKELRLLQEKHKDDIVPTFSVRWSDVCRDVADKLQELYELVCYYRDKELNQTPTQLQETMQFVDKGRDTREYKYIQIRFIDETTYSGSMYKVDREDELACDINQYIEALKESGRSICDVVEWHAFYGYIVS